MVEDSSWKHAGIRRLESLLVESEFLPSRACDPESQDGETAGEPCFLEKSKCRREPRDKLT
jgi:hypothetical protein